MKDKNETKAIECQKTGDPKARTDKNPWRKIVTLFVCLLILGVGIAGATYFKKTAPKARKRPPITMTPLVQTKRI